MDAIAQFREAMRSAGLEPPEVIEPGKLHRFATNGKRGDDAGWCKLFADGEGGVFGDFRSGLFETWQAQREKPFTSAEREAFGQRCEAEHRKREAEEAKRRAEAATKAAAIWKAATPANTDHPYLVRKGVKAYGLGLYRGDLVIAGMPCDGCLMVTAWDGSGVIHTLQFIHPEHRDSDNKRFLPGGATSGYYHSIGKPNGRILICEGYATGASIHECTGEAMAIAFGCGNLKPVAEALRGKYPEMEIVICADNDHWTEGNPGLTKAREAAIAVRGLLAVPQFKDVLSKPTDFNDLHRQEGAEAVRRCIKAAETPESVERQEGDEVTRLAAVDRAKLPGALADLAPIEYGLVRKALSEKTGCGVAYLDEARNLELRRRGITDHGAQGEDLNIEDPEPWEDPVDGAHLLNELSFTFRRHAVLPRHGDKVSLIT